MKSKEPPSQLDGFILPHATAAFYSKPIMGLIILFDLVCALIKAHSQAEIQSRRALTRSVMTVFATAGRLFVTFEAVSLAALIAFRSCVLV